MNKIKIAQIGTSNNSHGNDIWNTLKKNSDIFEIVGYCLPENEREKFPNRMPDFDGFKALTLEEILNDPKIEAVTVETEEIYLTKYALKAVKAGKHIHMEKPGGQNLSDFESLIEIVRKSNTVFHIGYMYRYNPFIIELLEKVKNGELGEITSVEAQMNCIHPKGVRQWFGGFKGGIMFFLGCHLIDLILQIQGIPTEVLPLNCSTGLDGVSAEDFGMAVLKYKNGLSFAKINTTEIGGFYRRQLAVTGTKGTFELKPLEAFVSGQPFSLVTNKTVWNEKSSKYGETEESQVFGRYDNMLISFASMVRGEKQNPYTPDYELELYKTILKCCGVAI